MAKQLRLKCETCYDEEASDDVNASKGCFQDITPMIATDSEGSIFKLLCSNCNTLYWFYYLKSDHKARIFKSEEKGQYRVRSVKIR